MGAGHGGSVPEAQAHDRAAGGAGAGVHFAALRHGQAADDEQADADAAETTAVARLALEEALEDPLVVAVGDADALVLHGDLDPGPAAARARTTISPPVG